MILAAGLLVLVGLVLFGAGLVTGTTVLYWATVAVCVVAAVLLVLSRRSASLRQADEPADGQRRAPATKEVPVAAGATAASAADEDDDAAPAEPVAAPAPPPAPPADQGEPPVEEVEVTDLLLVVDLKDEVLVVDEHPRYHLAECPRVAGRESIPLPLDEARTDGFTPCGICSPDRTLAERERARRAGRK